MVPDAIRRSHLARIFIVLALSAVMLVGADSRAPAASGPVLEVSTSCVAVKQDVPQLTVWGSGFADLLPVTVQWSAGNSEPAVVSPSSQQVSTGTFSITFDVQGVTPGSGSFNAFSASGRFITGVRVSINPPPCPTGSGTCTVGNPPALAVLVQGYPPPPQWGYAFYYQYHQPDQVGPVPGGPGLDGAAHATFAGLPQDAVSPTVTARIIEPGNVDTTRTFFVTFSVPVCRPPPATTSTSPTTNPSTTPSTTSPTTVVPATPSLIVSPKVGPDGTVASVHGTGFPANVNVTVLWRRGLGAVTAHTDAAGVFTVAMLVFPYDEDGPRTAFASGFPGASADFLVEPGPAGPPGVGGGQWLYRSNSAG